jgi:hypothetical protein
LTSHIIIIISSVINNKTQFGVAVGFGFHCLFYKESSKLIPMASIFRKLVQEAVAKHVDPWADKGIEKLPAELVNRYTYIPAKGSSILVL